MKICGISLNISENLRVKSAFSDSQCFSVKLLCCLKTFFDKVTQKIVTKMTTFGDFETLEFSNSHSLVEDFF